MSIRERQCWVYAAASTVSSDDDDDDDDVSDAVDVDAQTQTGMMTTNGSHIRVV